MIQVYMMRIKSLQKLVLNHTIKILKKKLFNNNLIQIKILKKMIKKLIQELNKNKLIKNLYKHHQLNNKLKLKIQKVKNQKFN